MRIKARIEWKLSDLWIGVFWKCTTIPVSQGSRLLQTDIWVCFIPCVPLHITIDHENLRRGSEAFAVVIDEGDHVWAHVCSSCATKLGLIVSDSCCDGNVCLVKGCKNTTSLVTYLRDDRR